MECEYCKKTLSTLSNLKYHQKTVKYCLKIQQRNNEGEFKCQFCEKSFYTKDHLQNHKKTCKVNKSKINEDQFNNIKEIEKLKTQNTGLVLDNEKLKTQNTGLVLDNEKLKTQNTGLVLDNEKLKNNNTRYTLEIECLKKEIDKLNKDHDKMIDKLSVPSNNTTNNNNKNITVFLQNAEPITEEYIIEQAKKLTYDQHVRGINGYIEHYSAVVKNRVVSTDPSRNKIKYKTLQGHIVKEIGHGMLFVNLCKSVIEKSKELSDEHKTRLSKEFSDDELIHHDFYRLYKDIKKSGEGCETISGNKILKKICEKNVMDE